MVKAHLYKTKIKITVAKTLYHIIKPFVGEDKKRIIRGGINYEVDLTEGIDFSLFLFGNFQKHIISNKLINLKPNATIVDIGANIGVMSLQFAKIAPQGQVYSFEPTHYAFKKLKRNLSLNKELAKRITPINMFLSQKSDSAPNIKAYSSWKIGGEKEKKSSTHAIHLGTVKSATGVKALSFDDFVKLQKLKKVDFIKIDTDGHEYEILQGAQKTLKKHHPAIIFEVGDYLLKEKNLTFKNFLDFFKLYGYTLLDSKSFVKINYKNWNKIIPPFSTIDILAISKKNERS